MERQQLVLGFFTGFLLAAAFFLATGAPAQEAETLDISASGQAKAEPDKAVVNLAVETRSDDPNTARSQLANQVSTMRNALRNAGITDDQVRTTEFSIYEEHQPRSPRDEPEQKENTTYIAQHSFEVELDDLQRTGEIIDIAVENGATRISDVRYTLSEEKRRHVKSQAIDDAVANAETQAEALATATQVTRKRVQSVSTADTQVSPFTFASREAVADSGTTIETGPVTVTADVHVSYSIR